MIVLMLGIAHQRMIVLLSGDCVSVKDCTNVGDCVSENDCINVGDCVSENICINGELI